MLPVSREKQINVAGTARGEKGSWKNDETKRERHRNRCSVPQVSTYTLPSSFLVAVFCSLLRTGLKKNRTRGGPAGKRETKTAERGLSFERNSRSLRPQERKKLLLFSASVHDLLRK